MQSNTLMFGSHCQYKYLADILVQARTKKNISLENMANILNVSSKRLEQIESGNFSMMYEIYTKSLIRKYAKEVNVDVEHAFNEIWSPQTLYSVAGGLVDVISVENDYVILDIKPKYLSLYGLICSLLLIILIISCLNFIITNKKNYHNIIITNPQEFSNSPINNKEIILLKINI